MEQNTRKPGRPPSFDREEVVRQAMRLFWRNGAGTSLDAVTEATGLHKPSVYAAFGGKRGLYLEALDAYVAEAGKRMGEALAREPLRAALEAFFEVDLEFFCGRDGVRGCFLISTASDAAAVDPDVKQRVERVFTAMRETMRARVARAAESGEPLGSVDVDGLTDLIASTHIAVSVEARAGRTRASLEEKVRRLLDFVAPA